MNKTLVLVGAFSTLGILLSGCSPRSTDMNATVSPTPETMLEQTDASRMSPTPVEASDSATMTYTIADVSQHSTATDCWTVISGEVYNLTPFVSQHPGGVKIVQICGKDGTALFSGQHGQQQLDLAQQFKIGTVGQ